MENLQINTMSDVRSFFYYLIHELELGAGFHPDTPIADYVDTEGKPTFTSPTRIKKLQDRLEYCFDVCEAEKQDIYEQGVEPRAYIEMLNAPENDPPMELNGYTIQWNDGWRYWEVDKGSSGFPIEFGEFQDAIEYALKG